LRELNSYGIISFMNLVSQELHAPRTQAEFNANIHDMLDGEPFWSIAPIELGQIPEDQAKHVLSRVGDGEYDHLYAGRYERYAEEKFGIKEALNDNITPFGEPYGHNGFGFLLNAGLFSGKSAPYPHIDTTLGGIRKTARSVIAAYPFGTLCYEGPMQVVEIESESGKIADYLDADILVKHLGEFYSFVPLEHQQPEPLKPGMIALLTECSVHDSPPRNDLPRWFGRQFLRPTDLFAQGTQRTVL